MANSKSSKTTKSSGINARYEASRGNGRPKPMTPKAGYTQTRRRYGEGGKA